ncbi:hypothetical protein A1Q1_04419 [Trichosporon asahii var. asahii CBS 2479]|uniref:Uncharacterized protein n=1 Tax=Trichosporon asahii var. asahii (strain ATCC 90039 / CBS 2479 / JCM 2466 / KCTC 7840 / NBRC 103889/ NCYC 2677 / UAMH 7654) TaxID=1186058 RepID=J5QDL6_TRIAS|nr:hypothetical protein A1Q1_04419 [Trichosporon asahii var. asahii CBS 2479]EJT46818.1 hypothetical protein A1Q1_04419 [Trichosporon asahii var. asahii CBS 2479]
MPPAAPVIPPDSPKRDTPMAVDEPTEEKPSTTEGGEGEDGEKKDGEEGEGDDAAPPTTRSKTAPQRKATETHPPIKRGIMTLSDVHAARAVLADKANQHWMKGLGGGQNREGETIVNFLYKNKVGHGRLLRVYNPTPAPFS